MKKLIIILFVVLLSYPVMAQEKTIFSGEMERGGYGGIFGKIGQIDGKNAIFMGCQGGWIINHRFVLGAKGYLMVNKLEESMLEVEGMQNINLEFGCWGALLEYIITPDKLLHLNIYSMIGAGSVRYRVLDYRDGRSDIDHSDDGFFVLEPGIDLIFNVYKNYRIGAGISYRYVNGVECASLSNSDLSGMSAQVILKFGVF